MALTRAERERIADNRMRIQSVANSPNHIGPAKIEDFELIQECLKDAGKNLAGGRSGPPMRRTRSTGSKSPYFTVTVLPFQLSTSTTGRARPRSRAL